MIAVGVLVLEVSADSETGKADARLAASLDTAVVLYDERLADTLRPLRDVAGDERVIAALEAGEPVGEGLAQELANSENLDSLLIRDADGRNLASVGGDADFALAQVKINGAEGRIGSVLGSTTNPTAYVADVRQLTGRDAVLQVDEETATTIPIGDVALPAAESAATVEVAGDEKRAASV